MVGDRAFRYGSGRGRVYSLLPHGAIGSRCAALYFCGGVRAKLAIARADAQPPFTGRHFRAGDPPEQRRRGGGTLMRVYWALVRRELGGHFFSWAGYVVIAIVLFLLGLSSVDLLQKLNGKPFDEPLTSLFYSPVY